MISKTHRFTTTALLDAASLPGPGSYSPALSTIPPVVEGAKPQSMFATPTVARKTIDPAPEPGPGTYSVGFVPSRETLISQKTRSAAFSDGVKRFRPVEPQSESNAPGSYDVGAAADFLKSYGKTGRGLDPSFASGSSRGAGMLDGTSVPGPGAYNPRWPSSSGSGGGPSLKAETAKPKKPPAAAPGPGPGWYQLGNPGKVSEAAASSAFRSGTVRFGGGRGKVRPPGPAYYEPRRPGGRKDFHLNVDGKWV